MNDIVIETRQKLLNLQDEKFREFQCRLIPNIDPKRIIGVRTPALRSLAKEMRKTGAGSDYIKYLPHKFFDENNLHAFILEGERSFDTAIVQIEEFLPYVDNWATCDQLSPRVLKKEPEKLILKIRKWLKSDKVYTVRFGLGMLMSHYLDENFMPEYLDLAASIRSDEYYVNMMTAWLFATALAKQYQYTIAYIEDGSLDKWTHNKAIQKALESRRITDEQKQYLRTLKLK